MSEIDQLKQRIIEAGRDGLTTAMVRDDYEPAGDLMIDGLVSSGEFITRRVDSFILNGGRWKIFAIGYDPYPYMEKSTGGPSG